MFWIINNWGVVVEVCIVTGLAVVLVLGGTVFDVDVLGVVALDVIEGVEGVSSSKQKTAHLWTILMGMGLNLFI